MFSLDRNEIVYNSLSQSFCTFIVKIVPYHVLKFFRIGNKTVFGKNNRTVSNTAGVEIMPFYTAPFSDLIKVSISLDTGKLTSLDATDFLLSNTKREAAKKTVSAETAAEKLSAELTLIKSKLAFIPLDSGKEALCYELHCKDDAGQEVLVYLDAYTAEQRDLLILLYSDGGVLTK